MRPLHSRLRAPLTAALLAVLVVGGGCRNRKQDASALAELVPPKDARPWESRFAVAFDDSYTPTAVKLEGRAPNDVLDQDLFQSRLGHADLIMLVRVEQVWGKGRYQGRQDQFVEVEVGEVLLGSLPKDAPETLMIEVQSIDELPGSLRGEIMLFFLRWDEDAEPPYHHHLMPAGEEHVALIHAMVAHAQEEGVLDAKGDEKKQGRRGRRGKRRKQGKAKGGSGPTEPVDDSSVPPGASTRGSSGEPVELQSGAGPESDEPPQQDAPRPDASTGLQELGGGGSAPADRGSDGESGEQATPEVESGG
ncbi:hypothetical protein G6O69_20320 [Pseudenhygromyxa sp. WMMC2535]|uniref:hypothetical protein n=1 Tax=Pseudenhygromyxa sp. WMMC2535 TaxID=2712867 RepID=UPI001553628E|nr:hypothetical protein [Pseudenhygromyxa sp. WMMC2535]NVB40204.1 hypothetical protein [Pseudenhygromyxa sp. WMMC2535]